MILPVVRAMRQIAPDSEQIVMALTIGAAAARSAGERPVGFADFLHLRDVEAVTKCGLELLPENAGGSVSEAESIAYLGVNFLELETRLGREAAFHEYRSKGRAAFEPVDFIADIIRDVGADIVVTTNSPRAERASWKAARRLGIPSLAMNDLLARQAKTFVGQGDWPDRICVLSDNVAEYLRREGAPHVAVTGNPAFDSMASREVLEAAEAFLEARGWESKRPVLFSGDIDFSKTGEERFWLLRRISEVLENFVEENPDNPLIFRYHPSRWREVPRPRAHPRIYFADPEKERPHPQIQASAAAIVQLSTIGLEASIADKPVISLENLEGYPPGVSWEAEGVSVACRDLEALPGMIRQALAGNLTTPRPFATDGQAAFRVGEQIRALF
ncbi:hypothetical protein [Algicella marina]|nr:hypothetical protein [Algicella marina]